MTDKKPDVETTGHNWDGITEYDIPSPMWWLRLFAACCVFAFGYVIFYPSFPYVNGTLGWTSENQLKESISEGKAVKELYLKKIMELSLDDIFKDSDLKRFAIAGGKSAFKRNCASCHGTGAEGKKGYPNLNDDDWLWGGKLSDIYTTIKYGIRSAHDETRDSEMPSFSEYESKEEIALIAEYVLSWKRSSAGAGHFEEYCSGCHGENGEGNRDIGAARLNDAIWLYGGTKEDIIQTITNGRKGTMPYWTERLDNNTIKQLTIYVHSLGGGE